jgi:hypothetical protein
VVRMVNVIVSLVVMFRGVTNLSMSIGVVPDVNTHGASAAGKTGDCDGGGCPKGLQFLSVATKSCVEGRGIDGGGQGFPMDFVCPIEDLIGREEDRL